MNELRGNGNRKQWRDVTRVSSDIGKEAGYGLDHGEDGGLDSGL